MIACTLQGCLYHCATSVHAIYRVYMVSVYEIGNWGWMSSAGWCQTSGAGPAAPAPPAMTSPDRACHWHWPRPGHFRWLCQAACQCLLPAPWLAIMRYIWVIARVQTRTIHLHARAINSDSKPWQSTINYLCGPVAHLKPSALLEKNWRGNSTWISKESRLRFYLPSLERQDMHLGVCPQRYQRISKGYARIARI